MAGKETVKGYFGNEPIELNNAASEATLMAMLKIAQKDSVVLAAMAKQAGVDAKKVEELLAEQQGGSGGSGSGKGMGLLGGAANLAGGFLMDMVGSVGKTIGSLMNFSQSLMDGTARASDFFKAFSGLPLGLGHFADALSFATKFFEKNLDTYRAISQTGAGLSSSLGGLRIQALELGLSMDEFAQIFQKNQRALGVLGGKSMETAKNLVAINTQLINGGLGRQLMGLGYSFGEINGLIGDYLAVTADGIRIDHDSATEQTRLAKAAGEYGKELDFLARLTGESREAIQKKMEADNQEASWQLYLNTLGPEAQKQATEAIARARMLGGKGGVDAIKSMFMGFAGPFSAEGQFFVATMRGGSEALKGMVAAVKSGQSSEIVSTQLNKLFAIGMESNIKDLNKFRTTIYAAGQGGAEGAKAFLELQEATKSFRGAHKESAMQILESIKAAQNKADADSKSAKAQAAADLAMKRMGAQLTTALLPALEMLNGIALSLIAKFQDFISSKGGMEKLKSAMMTFAEYIENLFSAAGRDKILNDFKYLFELMLIAVKEKLNFFYGKESADEDRKAAELNKAIIDAKAKEATLLERQAGMNQKLYDAQHKNILESTNKELQARVDKIESDKVLTAQEKIEKQQSLKAAIAENTARLNNVEDIKDVAKYQKEVDANEIKRQEAHQATVKAIDTYNEARANGFATPEKVKSQADSAEAMANAPAGSWATGTLGSGTLVKDFGKESRALLHGKEAVLTNEQLGNMAKGIQQSAPQINLASLDTLAEGIITLNRNTAMQNKILGTIAENQRTMINRATGNRLMV